MPFLNKLFSYLQLYKKPKITYISAKELEEAMSETRKQMEEDMIKTVFDETPLLKTFTIKKLKGDKE